MAKDKYALLDADFINKTYYFREDEEKHLIDRVLELPDYSFGCHEQIKKELGRNYVVGASKWLDNAIVNQKVCCYSDITIIEGIADFCGDINIACEWYRSFLKEACKTYEAKYFDNNFVKLKKLESNQYTFDEFCTCLQEDSDSIGEGKNLGEIKTHVLIQYLQFKAEYSIYIFCSDDSGARRGMITLPKIRCISALSIFNRLNEEECLNEVEAEPYINSCLKFYAQRKQTNFIVVEASKVGRHVRVPCEQVLRDIYKNKFIEIKNGMLKYK